MQSPHEEANVASVRRGVCTLCEWPGLVVPFEGTAEHVGAPTRGTVAKIPQSVYAVRK